MSRIVSQALISKEMGVEINPSKDILNSTIPLGIAGTEQLTCEEKPKKPRAS
jgi:hypothetical protein